MHTIRIDARRYENSDTCLQDAARDYAEDHDLSGWDLRARWEDDQRDTILLDVPAASMTYRLTLCESSDGWSLHAPGVTDEQIATGDAPYLASGTGMPSQSDYDRAAEVAAERAAEAIGSRWDGGECLYHDGGTGKTYHCDEIVEMVDLYARQSSADPEIANRAYSLWCADIDHEITS